MLFRDSAKPSVTLLKIQNCLIKCGYEIRPQDRRHIKLRIRKLPEEKIADSHFAACSNHQIQFRQFSGRKIPAKYFRR